MSLARAWRRQLFGASSAALIVPLAMLTALVVLALAGGFGRLGTLGQALSGPPVPPAAMAGSRGTQRAGSGTLAGPGEAVPVERVPGAAPDRSAGAPAPAASSWAYHAVSGGVAPGGGLGQHRWRLGQGSAALSSVPGRSPPDPSSRAPHGDSAGAATGGSAEAPAGEPAPPAARPTGAASINKIVEVGGSVTQRPSGPAAALATQALGAVGSSAQPSSSSVR